MAAMLRLLKELAQVLMDLIKFSQKLLNLVQANVVSVHQDL